MVSRVAKRRSRDFSGDSLAAGAVREGLLHVGLCESQRSVQIVRCWHLLLHTLAPSFCISFKRSQDFCWIIRACSNINSLPHCHSWALDLALEQHTQLTHAAVIPSSGLTELGRAEWEDALGSLGCH